ncbi:MauE/DoxX family redox-associated membrane protein [Sphingobacterium corticibacter]|uniref:DoxX family protein n=1 Tax=Sphingobacterium corticibacter TaxID=2171749 RepID=A0A2T8HNN2_9SPHI|nr:MauE/DoxX family redox-associated membrane protein [Sphingobacterium corticibacter]PVH27054.1 DoxX family protein [Sphingobacterium corticibacter]
MKIVKFILSLLFGLLFINAGLDKFLHYMPMPEPTPQDLEIFQAIEKLQWIMPLVGLVEIIGGLLFIFPKTRAIGAIVILPVMVGIVLHNYTFMPSGLAIAIPLLLINIWMIVDHRTRFMQLLAKN